MPAFGVGTPPTRPSERLRRLSHVSAASLLALGAALWAPHVEAQQPTARVEDVEDEALRESLTRAVGESSDAPGSRLEARRRAREAAENAVALLRSEGYYANRVEPMVIEEDPGVAVIRVQPGPRFTFADVQLA